MSEVLFSKVRNFSVTFPENIFGLDHVAADNYKKECDKFKRPFDEKRYKKMVRPYEALYFEENKAVVASNEEEVTVKMPWTIDMVKQLKAVEEGSIRCETAEQKLIARKSSGKEGCEVPVDFDENYQKYKAAYDALCKTFKAETKEECEEYISRLQEKIIKPFSIVNVATPEFKGNVPKFIKAIDLKRQTLAMLIEELFEK